MVPDFPQDKEGRQMRKLAAALCNIFGVLILLAVIGASLLLTVPKLFGYEMYNVVSGSMEPEIPVGSLIVVGAVQPENVSEGEIIAFESGESVVTHRVVQNKKLEGEFITKGDANEKEDINPVPYQGLIGRVEKYVPYMGQYMLIFTTNVGKVYMLCFAACGAMLNILAGRIRNRAKENEDDILSPV